MLTGILIIMVILGLAFGIRFRLQREGLRITSQFRSPQKNRKVGGVQNSLHQLGLAWDISFRTPGVESAIRRIRAALPVRIIKEKDHYHIQLDI